MDGFWADVLTKSKGKKAFNDAAASILYAISIPNVDVCTCLVTSGCAIWQLITQEKEPERLRRGGTEATVKSNEQENVKNVAKFAGIGQHQRQRSYSKSSRGPSLALLETHTGVDIGSGA